MTGDDEIQFPDGMPEDQREAIRAHMQRDVMAGDARAHAVLNFVTGMTVEGMKVFRRILLATQTNPNVASFYEGVISVHLATKEERCWACGTNHDEALRDVLAGGTGTPNPTTRAADPPDGDEGLTLTNDGVVTTYSREDYFRLAEAFNIVFDGPIGPNCPVTCKGCGFTSVSFQDRSLRQDCHRCIERAKWG